MSNAHEWIQRWDTQQERYIERREERFTVIGDVLEEVGPAEPKILDLCCGPGSLGSRLAARFPRAHVTGVDFDPVLLGLARTAHAGDPRRAWVETDLRHAGWWKEARLSPGFDAVVSTTALHWLSGAELTRVYRELAGLLRPGGVLMNGDHVAPAWEEPRLARIAKARRDLVQRDADARGSDTWEAWWEEISGDSAFTELWQERRRRFGDRHGEEPITLDFHLAALRQAGFVEANVVWQRWDDVVMAALVQ
ncbi:methyltransferase domain-containing protein [Pendulispora rubella]|uniref:Methyltransferase domain-containing protein n=1 Tax=Pendulispora rubella TaxID=2741070 RepID=A0ABZ2LE54_9BACT